MRRVRHPAQDRVKIEDTIKSKLVLYSLQFDQFQRSGAFTLNHMSKVLKRTPRML